VPLPKAYNRLVHGTSRIPVGERRAALIAFLKDQKVDLVLSEFGTEALGVTDLAHEMGLPCFTYFRGSDASYSLRSPSRVRGYKKMMPKLTGIFAVSQFLIDNLARYGVTHSNAHVMPSGVDVRWFQPGAKRPHSYAMVGRMVEKKFPLMTISAFLDATVDAPEATLDVIGDGPLLSAAQTLVAEAEAADRVNFHGAVPHAQVRDILAATSVFLQHSVTARDGNTEGLPTSIQEALACGCAVISTRHAGIPEAIDEGFNGWLCDEHDAAAYTALIRESLTADMTAMTANARRTAQERFDNAILLQKTEDVLRAAL